MNAPFRVAQIDHVELWVPNQREAAAWYEKVLGLAPVEEFADWAETGPLMIATAEAATRLALFEGEPEPSAGGRTPDFRRVAFRVDGPGFVAFLDRLDELELAAEGGGRLSRDDLVDHGKALSIYFRDPWKHALELTTYDAADVREHLAGV